MISVCSLRQHDLDQVIRVERGSLLSVPHRRTPRSIVDDKYTLIFQTVNRMKLKFRERLRFATDFTGYTENGKIGGNPWQRY